MLEPNMTEKCLCGCGETVPLGLRYVNNTHGNRHRSRMYYRANREAHNKYVRAWQKTHPRKPKEKPEARQVSIFDLPAPAGPPCRVCGKPLHHYDIDRGECFRHPVARLRTARESVPLMMTDKPQRTRVQRRYHQQQAAPVAGD
jgi:hypothetical protein